jgi:hypothetical protein
MIAAGVVLAGALLLLVGPPTGSNRMIARSKCKEYYDAAVLWTKVHGRAPARIEEMEAPLRAGDSAFIESVDDPWGNPYVLEHEGAAVRIRCVGPDGQAHTEDDIVYPEERR